VTIIPVDDQLLVYRLAGGAEGVERGRTCPIEDPEHGEVLSGVLLDGRPDAPAPKQPPKPRESFANARPGFAAIASGVAFGPREGRRT
jgi:hypothetical protein